MTQTNLFISHASEDKDFVRHMTECLNMMNIQCWFDEQEIHSGDSIPQKINEGLATSTHGILVLSADYLRDDKFWTWEELAALINIESVSTKRQLIPIRLGLDHAQLTRSAPLIAHRLSIDFADNPKGAAEEIALILKKGGKTVRPLSGEPIPDEGLPTRHNVPMTRPFGNGFVGRDSLINSLINQLIAGRKCDFSEFGVFVVSGIPGSGKSTIVCELAYRIGRQFSGGVFWLDARNTVALNSSAKDIGQLLQLCSLNTENELKELFDNIRRYFEDHPCLVIFDALDSECDLTQIMPKAGLSRVAISTRTERLDIPIKLTYCPVTEIDLISAGKILMQFRTNLQSTTQIQTVNDICHELGSLPLALQLASRYLRSHSTSLSDYLEKLRERGPAWKGLASTIKTIPSVIEVLKQCIEALEGFGSTGELAKKILRRCAAIDLVQGKLHRWDQISLDRKYPLGLASSVGVNCDDEDATDQFDEAIEILEQVGLIRLIPDSNTDVWAHSLTLQFARNYLDIEDAHYLSFRLRTKWSETQNLMGLVGWVIYFPNAYQSAKCALPIMKKLSPDAALDALSTLYLMADFSDQDVTECIIDEAIEFANMHNEDSKRSVFIMSLRIDKAYSVYKDNRLEDAEKLYNQLSDDLKTSPTHTDKLSDFLFYFGCLLLELGNDNRRFRALKLWDEAIEIITDELTNMESNKAPSYLLFQLKLRLSRLLAAKAEKFPEISLKREEELLSTSLATELSPHLSGFFSWNKQFLDARRPVVIAMPVRTFKK